ncbi:MAG: Flagellar M-ring protein [Pseudomonadota bacterium]|jgi:flagellar M-ring protein FliF
MAEATINPGGAQPPTPPGVPTVAGDPGTAGVPATMGPGNRPLPTAVQGVASGFSSFRDWMDGVIKQPAVKRALLPITVLLVLGVTAVVFQSTQSVPYRPIMPGMTENDKMAALEALKAGDFKPKVDTQSGQITVPEGRYHEARIFLAGQGIPKEAQPIGMESLKDKSSMTTSQFMEQVQYNTAIEQELSRSIMQISTIKAARVHLALPKQSVFVRDRATPKASVVVTPHSGRGVSTPQVKAIVHLVSSSVPYLTPENVSVVDDQGNLLTMDNPVDAAMGLTVAQMQHKQRTEETYKNRVTELLGPVVGEAAVQAQVNLTMDYTTIETTTEDFDDKDKGVKPRSEALTTERKFKLDPEGIPGSLTNSPPPDADLTKNTNTDEKKPATNEIVTTRSTRNFEMDRQVRHTKNSPGTISRITVAVVVAERPAPPPADGKPLAPGAPTTIPYTQQELDRMLNLVRSAVGYNEERGDVVTVAPARFETLAPEPPKPWYADPDIQNVIKIAVAAFVIVVFLLAVVRPLVKGPTINQQIMPPYGPTPEEVKQLEAKAAEEAKAELENKLAEEAKIAEEEAKAEEEAQAAADALAAEEARIAEEAEQYAAAEAAAIAEAAAAEAGEGEGEDGEFNEDEIELEDGESLDELRARMQAMKPKKPTFSAEMLDTANSYDDKVALIRMLVAQESGRVALVLKNMVRN